MKTHSDYPPSRLTDKVIPFPSAHSASGATAPAPATPAAPRVGLFGQGCPLDRIVDRAFANYMTDLGEEGQI